MSGSVDPWAVQPGGLPPELLELQEILAENVHDAWARQRIAEGWVRGTVRDEQARTHPGLVPYEQLLEDPLATLRHLYTAFQLGDFDLTSPAAIRYLQAIKNHVPQCHGLSESAEQHLESRITAIRSSTPCPRTERAIHPKGRHTVAPDP